MKNIGLIRISAILALGGIMAAQANADIAYNDFGTNDTFDNVGTLVGGTGNGTGQGLAMSFSSATTGAVSLIRLALYPGFNYNISINVDDNGLPGTAMETWTGVPGDGLTDVSGDGSAMLAAGFTYWVVVLSDGHQSEAGERFDSGDDAAGGFAKNWNGGAWVPNTGALGAYRVETRAVPEPEPVLALGLSAAMVATRKCRKA